MPDAIRTQAFVTMTVDRSIFATLLPMISKLHGYDLRTGRFLFNDLTLGIAIIGLPAGCLWIVILASRSWYWE